MSTHSCQGSQLCSAHPCTPALGSLSLPIFCTNLVSSHHVYGLPCPLVSTLPTPVHLARATVTPTRPVDSEKGCRDPQVLWSHPTVRRLPLRRARGWPRGGRASGRQTLQVSLASPDLCSLTELSPLARSQGLGGPRWAEADTQREVAFLNQCP